MKKIILYIIAIVVLLPACSKKTEYPTGNLSRLYPTRLINSPDDELAPFLKNDTLYYTVNSHDDNDKAFQRSRVRRLNIRKSKEPSLSAMEFNLPIINTGAVCFTGDDEGFMSMAYPLSKEYLNIYPVKDKKFSGSTSGGTDIVQFKKNRKTNKTEFKYLEEINSPSFDSHPTAYESCNTKLLVFSSDREDESGNGYSRPFNNSDLYFAFQSKGSWSKVRNLNEICPYNTNGKIKNSCAINSNYNEYTPFLFPWKGISKDTFLLFFSSDRPLNNGDEREDYDIFAVMLFIDFTNQIIDNLGFADLGYLQKDRKINTFFDEMYPMLKVERDTIFMYFSSNRDTLPSPIVRNGRNIYVKNAGKFDLYRFPVDLTSKFPMRSPIAFSEELLAPEPTPPAVLPELVSWNITVPYFLTGYWKPTTSSNLAEFLEEVNDEPDKLPKLIDLHPQNAKYAKNKSLYNKHLEKFKDYSQVVDEQVNKAIANLSVSVNNFQKYLEMSENAEKPVMVIRIKAWSDPRKILSGEYTGEDIELKNPATNFGLRIRKGDKLDADNANLSLLRAYYSYQEIISKLYETNPAFKEYVDRDRVYLPAKIGDNSKHGDQPIRSSDIRLNQLRPDKISNKELIVVLFSEVDDESPDADERTLDRIRRAEIEVEFINYDMSKDDNNLIK